MPWNDWLDIPIVRAVVRHTSGTVVSIPLFWVVAWTIKFFLPEGLPRTRIEKIEGVVLVGLFAILAIQLALVLIKEVWRQLKGGWNGTQVLAV
jgi:hypothetical protein